MLYDYKCKKCGEIFEVWATLAEKENGVQPKCPRCSSETTQQIIRALNLGVSTNKSGNLEMPPTCGPAEGCC